MHITFVSILDKERQIVSAVSRSIFKPVPYIRLPFAETLAASLGISKSYIWFMDDSWAALVALAAIIILLCIVGIIVMLFAHSR